MSLRRSDRRRDSQHRARRSLADQSGQGHVPGRHGPLPGPHVWPGSGRDHCA
ncbi:hypothetical protein APX70_200504 [Pseudomonas syringae pv. maculicola]|uniref:Uncharacterized protein n=1 Tax=Pseudomonas syringae pv. maculicola TaxID=59511 RepID=A0A3M2U7E7_PSEYM|nr:hypothetical protein APX70_200504 [Pseudomonas syringae pv. maculicola]